MFFLTDFLSAFLLLFVIMEPFGSIPVLFRATHGLGKPKRAAAVNKAVLIAAGVMVFFALFGVFLLDVLGIDLTSFRIAGGLVLAILGLQLVLGFSFSGEKKKDYDTSIIVIGTPMITGPGVITTVIVLTSGVGVALTLLAAGASLLLTWIILRASLQIQQVFGAQLVEIISRIMGILLVAMAIAFIRSALLPV